MTYLPRVPSLLSTWTILPSNISLFFLPLITVSSFNSTSYLTIDRIMYSIFVMLFIVSASEALELTKIKRSITL